MQLYSSTLEELRPEAHWQLMINFRVRSSRDSLSCKKSTATTSIASQYLLLTNSALLVSPLYKYRVPVNICTTVTFSSFFTFFIFFLSECSGCCWSSNKSWEEFRVERVPTRVLGLDDFLNFFWSWNVTFLPIFSEFSSDLRFLLDDPVEFSVEEAVDLVTFCSSLFSSLPLLPWLLPLLKFLRLSVGFSAAATLRSSSSEICSFLRRRSDGATIHSWGSERDAVVGDFLTRRPLTVLPFSWNCTVGVDEDESGWIAESHQLKLSRTRRIKHQRGWQKD